MLVAAGQAQRRRIIGDRGVQRQLPLPGQPRHHVAGDALGQRGPAEHRVRSHRLAVAGGGLAIALEEADLAILDDADCEPDHAALGSDMLQPLVDPADSRSGWGC